MTGKQHCRGERTMFPTCPWRRRTQKPLAGRYPTDTSRSALLPLGGDGGNIFLCFVSCLRKTVASRRFAVTHGRHERGHNRKRAHSPTGVPGDTRRLSTAEPGSCSPGDRAAPWRAISWRRLKGAAILRPVPRCIGWGGGSDAGHHGCIGDRRGSLRAVSLAGS